MCVHICSFEKWEGKWNIFPHTIRTQYFFLNYSSSIIKKIINSSPYYSYLKQIYQSYSSKKGIGDRWSVILMSLYLYVAREVGSKIIYMWEIFVVLLGEILSADAGVRRFADAHTRTSCLHLPARLPYDFTVARFVSCAPRSYEVATIKCNISRPGDAQARIAALVRRVTVCSAPVSAYVAALLLVARVNLTPFKSHGP